MIDTRACETREVIETLTWKTREVIETLTWATREVRCNHFHTPKIRLAFSRLLFFDTSFTKQKCTRKGQLAAAIAMSHLITYLVYYVRVSSERQKSTFFLSTYQLLEAHSSAPRCHSMCPLVAIARLVSLSS